jgi:DNA mismatch endonuclease Vsr
MGNRPKEIISYNMSRIRSKGTILENKLELILQRIDRSYVVQPKMFGNPDFAYIRDKVVIFADSDFWHGFQWEKKKLEIKANENFWIQKLERNMARDKEVTKTLQREGWVVIRLWGHDIIKNPEKCYNEIREILLKTKTPV